MKAHSAHGCRSLDYDFSGSIGADEFKRLLLRYNLHMDDEVYLESGECAACRASPLIVPGCECGDKCKGVP